MLSRIQLMPAEINTMDLCPSGKLDSQRELLDMDGAGADEFKPLGLTASRHCSSVFPRDFSQIFLFASFISVM